MTATLTEVVSKQARPAEGVLLFLRRWLAHPLRMGSIVPSSQTLCKRLVRHGWPRAGTVVLELGAGTGVVSRAFLDAGLSPERLVVVEVDSSMVRHLRDTLPGVTVIEGDARNAADLMPARFKGRIGSVICGIPLVLLPVAEQRRFTHAMEAVAPGRGFLHFSYCVTSPLSGRKLGLRPKREAWTPLNLPPASVWRYTQAALPPDRFWTGRRASPLAGSTLTLRWRLPRPGHDGSRKDASVP